MKNLTTWFFEGTWKTLEVWTSKAIECCKQSSKSCFYRNLQDSSAGSNVERGDLAVSN